MQYRLRSLRTPQNLFDRMKNCIERVELSFGFAVRVFVLVGSVFTYKLIYDIFALKNTCFCDSLRSVHFLLEQVGQKLFRNGAGGYQKSHS